jgi:hypothetical protein
MDMETIEVTRQQEATLKDLANENWSVQVKEVLDDGAIIVYGGEWGAPRATVNDPDTWRFSAYVGYVIDEDGRVTEEAEIA